jgi:DNA mismatch repair protein MutS
MTFQSILSERPSATEALEAPAFFRDLHLDQIVEAIIADWKDYNLAPFFYARLNDLDAIIYRQEIMRELEDRVLVEEVNAFSHQMRMMRERLKQAKKFDDYKYARQRCFLTAAQLYYAGVERLAQALSASDPKSRGLRAFRVYLSEYVTSNPFRQLATQTHKLQSRLSAIRYSLLIRDGGVTVRHCEAKSDYSYTIEQTFRKFRQSGPQNYWVELRKRSGMNHIEAQVQERVALLYRDTFRALDAFCAEQAGFLDSTVERFDREIQFYVAYLTYINKLRRTGVIFCQPRLSRTSKEIRARKAFDLALAGKLTNERASIVPNDFFLACPERVFVVSGPNQGGKTTFARMFGQMHYLATLGCPVPGEEAQLFLFDQLFTHFEREEDISNLRGKLQDDLIRMREILDGATPNSLLVMNELFTSTTLRDAVELSKKVMEKISTLDLIGVWVTFLDELASFNAKTVSLVSQVDPHDAALRTYKLERKPADGLAFALAIAQKHRVTYDWLKERINL